MTCEKVVVRKSVPRGCWIFCRILRSRKDKCTPQRRTLPPRKRTVLGSSCICAVFWSPLHKEALRCERVAELRICRGHQLNTSHSHCLAPGATSALHTRQCPAIVSVRVEAFEARTTKEHNTPKRNGFVVVVKLYVIVENTNFSTGGAAPQN